MVAGMAVLYSSSLSMFGGGEHSVWPCTLGVIVGSVIGASAVMGDAAEAGTTVAVGTSVAMLAAAEIGAAVGMGAAVVKVAVVVIGDFLVTNSARGSCSSPALCSVLGVLLGFGVEEGGVLGARGFFPSPASC